MLLALASVLLLSAPPPSTPPESSPQTVLVLGAVTHGLRREPAAALDAAIARGVAARVAADVVSADDVRVIAACVVDPGALDCVDGPCLIGVAKSLGARFVVSGRFEKIDATHVSFALSSHDGQSGAELARASLAAADIAGLMAGLEGALATVTAPLPQRAPTTTTTTTTTTPTTTTTTTKPALLSATLLGRLPTRPRVVARLAPLLLVVDDAGALWSFDPATGTSTKRAGSFPDARVLVATGGGVLVIGTSLQRVDARSFAVRTLSTESWATTTSAVMWGGSLYVADLDRVVYKADPETGIYEIEGAFHNVTRTLLATGSALWRISGDGDLSRIDPSQFQTQRRSFGWTMRATATRANTLFTVEADGRLVATSLESGRSLVVAAGFESVALVALADRVLAVEADGRVLQVVLNPR